MRSATDASRAMRRSMGMEPSSAPRLARGTIIAGRYRIIDVLGEGGMGTVYRAEQPALHRQVALKVVRPEFSADASMVARFEREAYASSRISSPHVVVVHDFGRDDSGVLYLIMELLEGESLATRLEREGAMSLDDALHVCRDVARALEVAHAAGIVHRDLKPDNVFLTTQGDVKVLDFGIARIVEGPGGSTVGNATMTGMIVGTPVYMSPEAISRAPVGPATDLYALGVMLFEMLSGQPPFMADEAVILMSAHLTQPPPRLETLVPSLAKKPAVLALISRLLEKSASARGETRAASAELTRLVEHHGDGPAPASARADAARPRPGAWLGVAAALLVLGVAGVGALAWIESSSAPEVTPATSTPSPPTTIAASTRPATEVPPTTETPATETPPSAEAATEVPPPVAAEVVVTLTGLPEGAEIESDGAVSGHTITLARGSGSHTATVRAPGFAPAVLALASDEDASHEVTLEPLRRRVRPTAGTTTAGGAETTAPSEHGLRREF